MKQIVLGIDIDGVLANFNNGYRDRLEEVTGRQLIVDEFDSAKVHEPPCWYYACDFYGYTKEEDKATWKSIMEDADFWLRLEPLDGAREFLRWVRMIERTEGVEAYFITTRPGVFVKEQSEEWIEEQIEERFEVSNVTPTVLIARGAKGLIANGLGLTHFLDDKPENCLSVAESCPDCEVYMISCKYNEWAQRDGRYQEAGITVIKTLDEFVSVVDREQRAA